MRSSSTVRAVALFEAAKGALVLLAGFGSLSLIDHDAQRLAEQLVGHLHLNPAKHYPRIFIDTAAHLTDARLWLVATLAAAYGLVRFVEACGEEGDGPNGLLLSAEASISLSSSTNCSKASLGSPSGRLW
jgi:uncharacterized membrane protein (DUF2068 family)